KKYRVVMANGVGWQSANRLKIRLIFAVLLVMTCHSKISVADTFVTLESGYEQYSLNSYVRYLLDDTGLLSLQDAMAADGWHSNLLGTVLNFGCTDATVWVRARVIVPSQQPQDWHLVVPYPLLESVRLFVLNSQLPHQYHEVEPQV